VHASELLVASDAPHPMEGDPWWREIAVVLSGPGEWAVISLPYLEPVSATANDYETRRRAALAALARRVGPSIVATDPSGSGIVAARAWAPADELVLELAPGLAAGDAVITGVRFTEISAGVRPHLGEAVLTWAVLDVAAARIEPTEVEVALGGAPAAVLPAVALHWALPHDGEVLVRLSPHIDEERAAALGAPPLLLTLIAGT
jgi:hypothetical protein